MSGYEIMPCYASEYDFMLTKTYISITKQLVEYWEDYISTHDENIVKQIEDFKRFYNNYEDFDLYFNFDISSQAETILAQRFIVQQYEKKGHTMPIRTVKALLNKKKLEYKIILHIMKGFNFNKYAKDKRYCDNRECPYSICFEELEKYYGKDWVCEKCSTTENATQNKDLYTPSSSLDETSSH